MSSTSDKDISPSELDLSLAWRNAVESGQAASEFKAPLDDPGGRWKSGDEILLGVVHTRQGFRYTAKNLSAGKVINVGVEEKEISGTEFRCQLNGCRSLRPRESVSSIGRRRAISPNPLGCKFYCQDPSNPLSLLRRAPLARLRLKNHLWHAYYNAAPLEIEGHFMWIPARVSGAELTLPHHLQSLDRAAIEDAFLLRDTDANFVLLFNSLHAGASVNHLHLHAVYRRHALAIEKQPTVARGDFHLLDAYPAEGFVFQGARSVEHVSEHVIRLQEMGIPFNLVWAGERVFLVPRDIEHEVTEEFPFDTLSAIDVCGKIVTADRATYESVTKERVEAALRKSARLVSA